MQPEITQKTNDVLCRVMESLAFIFVDPIASDSLDVEQDITEPYVHAHISFDGPHCGRINLHLPNSMLGSISANMLGVDEDDPDALSKQIDAVRELLNVICGQTLTDLWDSGLVFNLGIPSVDSVDQEQVKPIAIRPNTTCFSSDEGMVFLEIEIH